MQRPQDSRVWQFIFPEQGDASMAQIELNESGTVLTLTASPDGAAGRSGSGIHAVTVRTRARSLTCTEPPSDCTNVRTDLDRGRWMRLMSVVT